MVKFLWCFFGIVVVSICWVSYMLWFGSVLMVWVNRWYVVRFVFCGNEV